MVRNVPHATVLKCPFYEEELSDAMLGRLVADLPDRMPTLRLSGLTYQPVNWAFANLAKDSWLSDFQGKALDVMAGSINPEAIVRQGTIPGHTSEERPTSTGTGTGTWGPVPAACDGGPL